MTHPSLRAGARLALALCTTLAAGTAGAHETAGPADAWVYPMARPGSYALPAIRPAADAALIDSRGQPVRLARLIAGRLAVIGFVYTRCADICPLASHRMAELRALAAGDPALADALTLVSISFDPAHDTPAVMAGYAARLRQDDPALPEWRFLTAEGSAAIRPVLADWDQPVTRRADAAAPAGPLAHLLRVYLVDRAGMIRNIYSADFLDPRLVLSDLRTLLIAEAGR